MTAAPRIIRFALGGLSLSLTAIIAVEILSPVSDVAALPRPAVESRQLPGDLMGPPFDADKLIAEILDRPLFTPGRHPPEAQADAAAEEEEKKPPELQSRLAGVMIRPDESEALFTRNGEKPIAVGEGDEIDGWTVDTIEADRVVLTSDFGEKILQPTPEERTTAIPAAPPARNKKPAPALSVKPGTPAAIRPAAAGKMPAHVMAAPRKKNPVNVAASMPVQIPPQVKVPPVPNARISAIPSSQTAAQTGRSGPQPWGL